MHLIKKSEDRNGVEIPNPLLLYVCQCSYEPFVQFGHCMQSLGYKRFRFLTKNWRKTKTGRC